MTRPPSQSPMRRALATVFVALLAAALLPAAVMARGEASSRYLVVFNGEYALDGSYALGAGYALASEYALEHVYALEDAYALDAGYALGSGYALAREYALSGTYALDDSYALGREYALYALDGSYALYALDEAYALATEYALGDDYALKSEYALATEYALYALDSLYALAESYALDGTYALDSVYALLREYALDGIYALDDNYALARDYALWLVDQAGGTVTADLTGQLGVMVVDSKNAAFAETMSSYALVQGVVHDFGWKQFPTYDEAIAAGALTVVDPSSAPRTLGDDPLESLQWNMRQINTAGARKLQAGSPNVTVGIVDTGIDGNHVDFVNNGRSNVDCARGADFTAQGPGIGIPAACIDNNFHGTHVAGIVAARANGHGVVGVAPNVTLVPIKVCDADGHCYASDVVEGITYAGDLALNIINMSFYVDDDAFQQSTEFKCGSDPEQQAFREAVQRAVNYARGQGVTPVAALGNSNTNLANPPGGKDCKVVPAMSDGVVGTMSLGPESGKAHYSSYGTGWADVAAPGGAAVAAQHGASSCTRQVVSTIPGNLWACFQGTSMASPHAAGVSALIASQYGKPDPKTARWLLAPKQVTDRLEKSAFDIGLKGYDMCFGNGRVDALRAVLGDQTRAYDSSAPMCAEYNQ